MNLAAPTDDTAFEGPDGRPAPRPPVARPGLLLARHPDVLAVAAVLLVTGLVYWRTLRSGGLFFDDWWMRAAALYDNGPRELTPLFGYFEGLWHITGFRPTLVLVLAVQIWLADGNPHLYQALAMAETLFAALALYACLRVARVPWGVSTAAGVLFAGLPIAASTRFWLAGGVSNLAMGFLFSGFAIGGLAVRATSRRSRLLLGAVSVLSMVTGALAYETVVPLMALLPPYYLASSGGRWRPSLAKAGADVALVAAALLVLRTSGRTDTEAASTWWGHAQTLFGNGTRIFLRALTPDREVGWITLLVLVVLAGLLLARIAGGPAAWWREARQDLRGPGRAALALATVGYGAGLLGYVLFIPASSWYNPLFPGQGDRTNGVAGAGFALAYAGIALGISAVLASGRRHPEGRVMRNSVFALLLVLLSASFVQQSRARGDQYVKAWRMSQTLVAEIPATFPNGPPPPGTTIFSFGATAYAAPLVPALAEWSDLDGAVKLALRTGQVGALPIFEPQEVVCAAAGVEFPTQYGGGPVLGDKHARPYGTFVFMNAFEHRAETIVSQAHCLDALTRFRPGPLA